MANENLISTLEQSLRQTQLARNRLASRLVELETEADSIRAQLLEMDNIIAQTRSTMLRLVTSVPLPQPPPASFHVPSDDEIEAAIAGDYTQVHNTHLYQQQNYRVQQSYQPQQQPTYQSPHNQTPPVRHDMPPVRSNLEVKSDRFADRTIPQAVTLLLREEGGPLHVNELYSRLVEGGFEFSGNNPTISIAVSLNRNTRFRKVAPGTFDLVMREASHFRA